MFVIQADPFNRSGIATCIVAAMTSNTSLAEHPGNVFVPATASGLERDSVVNVTQVASVDKGSLRETVGALPGYLVDEVDRGLRLVLSL